MNETPTLPAFPADPAARAIATEIADIYELDAPPYDAVAEAMKAIDAMLPAARQVVASAAEGETDASAHSHPLRILAL